MDFGSGLKYATVKVSRFVSNTPTKNFGECPAPNKGASRSLERLIVADIDQINLYVGSHQPADWFKGRYEMIITAKYSYLSPGYYFRLYKIIQYGPARWVCVSRLLFVTLCAVTSGQRSKSFSQEKMRCFSRNGAKRRLTTV